jgi:hypothetical protein
MTNFSVTVPVEPHPDGRHCGDCAWSRHAGGACVLFSRYSLAELDESRDNMEQYLSDAMREYDTDTRYMSPRPGGRLLDPWLRCRACLAAQGGTL